MFTKAYKQTYIFFCNYKRKAKEKETLANLAEWPVCKGFSPFGRVKICRQHNNRLTFFGYCMVISF